MQGARITIQKSSPDRIKLNKFYKYCFELENDTRTWIIACQSEQDLIQWYTTIQVQIEQVAKRIAVFKLNQRIVEREVEKSNMDMKVVQSLIRPNNVMFDPLQKSNLIGFLTNKDVYLNKLISMISVYLEQIKNNSSMI